MNVIERWKATVAFEPFDRPVWFETLGFWAETLRRWSSEGLPEGVNLEATAFLYFKMDLLAPVMLGGAYDPGFYPPVEVQIMEETDRYRLRHTESGNVVKEFKDGSSTIPEFLEFPVKTRDDFEKIRFRLSPEDGGRYSNWEPFMKMSGAVKVPLMVYFCGLFGLARHLLGFERLMTTYFDDPGLIHDIGEQWTELCCGALDYVARKAQIHGIAFWEDMCFKNGPLISPAMFREFMLPCYKRVTERAREHGAFMLWVDSDGNVEKLLPLFLEGGVNVVFPFEVQAENDIFAFREQYGKDLVIMGGIDKREMAKSKDAIEAEIERVVVPMLEKGGYVPSLDHGVPPDVPLENFRFFLDRVREVGRKYGTG